MKEYPVLFNGEMVRAILDGRKTQTRRPVYGINGTARDCWDLREVPSNPLDRISCEDGEVRIEMQSTVDDTQDIRIPSPFGGPGDLLWVRECWKYCAWGGSSNYVGIRYRADRATVAIPDMQTQALTAWAKHGCKWRPSIHMPRLASRITLEVKRVWVERVQDTKPEDWLAELGTRHSDYDQANIHQYWREKCWAAFCELWDSIYATKGYGWTENPWVWACEFAASDRSAGGEGE